jgi:hypothetical protein
MTSLPVKKSVRKIKINLQEISMGTIISEALSSTTKKMADQA